MSCQKHLNKHDAAIFNALFNPSQPFEEVPDEAIHEVKEQEKHEDTPEEIKAKEFEVKGVKAAEAGNIDEAIEFFCEAIQTCPSGASGYNNKAQALQLKGDVHGALADLNKAVELTEGKGHVACQAFTQRGIIKRMQGNDDDALEDFKFAAALGGTFAKQQVVALNPYAALCNKMMTEMIDKVRRGEDTV